MKISRTRTYVDFMNQIPPRLEWIHLFFEKNKNVDYVGVLSDEIETDIDYATKSIINQRAIDIYKREADF